LRKRQKSDGNFSYFNTTTAKSKGRPSYFNVFNEKKFRFLPKLANFAPPAQPPFFKTKRANLRPGELSG
jgi:hypothetical protein